MVFSNSVLIQWGYVFGILVTVNFPLTFSELPIPVGSGNNGVCGMNYDYNTLTTSSVKIGMYGANANSDIYWIAIGY